MPERFSEFVGRLHRHPRSASQEEAGRLAPPPICGYFPVVVTLSAQDAEQTVMIGSCMDSNGGPEIGADIEAESGNIRTHAHACRNVGRHVAEEPTDGVAEVTKQSIH